MSEHASTVDAAEVARFSALAEQWWNPEGPFRPLHQIMPVRLDFIRRQLLAHFALDAASFTPLTGLRLLDIGCGGGLLSEAMARLGASVTAIDASEKNIAIAALHAEQSSLSIDYRHSTAEALAAEGASFDIVLNMEVVEHVADVPLFMHATCALVKPGGMMLLSTMNRTPRAFALAILGAEYILRWLPRGTHQWKKFLKPSEIARYLREEGMETLAVNGMVYRPFSRQWQLDTHDVSVNYLLAASK